MLPFFQANRQYLVQHVKRPEPSAPAATTPSSGLKLPGAASAAPVQSDFIQLDHYGQFPFTALPRDYNAAIAKYNRRTLNQYGLLPWEIGVYSKKLTDAFRDRNWTESKHQRRGIWLITSSPRTILSTPPPISTEDSRFSPASTSASAPGLVDRYQLFFFVKTNDAVYIHDPTDHAFEMVLTSHSWLEPVLLADRRAHTGLTEYKEDFYDRFYAQAGAILVSQFSNAATDVGSYLDDVLDQCGPAPASFAIAQISIRTNFVPRKRI